jgi:hypothetical protein
VAGFHCTVCDEERNWQTVEKRWKWKELNHKLLYAGENRNKKNNNGTNKVENKLVWKKLMSMGGIFVFSIMPRPLHRTVLLSFGFMNIVCRYLVGFLGRRIGKFLHTP